jgi:hypothetical protein
MMGASLNPEGGTMRWETPEITEIKMDAEVTAYQDDFEPDGNAPLVEPALPRASEEPAER